MLKIMFTDLDGTLLRKDRTFNPRDISTLSTLESSGVVRVIATGRNYVSARRVLPEDFPIDFLIFSTGAGVIDWKSKELIYERNLSRVEINRIYDIFRQYKMSFMVHQGVPENHRLMWFDNGDAIEDFWKRIGFYREFAVQGDGRVPEWENACQFVAIVPESRTETFFEMEKLLEGLTVVRTTSPLDGRSLWVEVFSPSVSKGKTACWLAERIGASPRETAAVGNDYNDLDLLRWAGSAFVVSNAPEALRREFPAVASHEEAGFTEAAVKSSELTTI
jgi:hypothetical protein